MKKIILLSFFLIGSASSSHAALHKEWIEYKQGSQKCRSYFVTGDTSNAKRPGILVIPEWKGLTEYAQKRADQLAELGYAALAVDVYGDGKIAADASEAAKISSTFKSNRPLLRARVQAALDILKKQPVVDAKMMAAIGYCFGGMAALELARSGADIDGVVSFHGGLDTPMLEDAKNIKGHVLVLHGANDPYVPVDQVLTFQDEMRKANVDWQMTIYSGAVHGFTNPDNGNDPSKGVAYNTEADHRSWIAMKSFFDEIFKAK